MRAIFFMVKNRKWQHVGQGWMDWKSFHFHQAHFFLFSLRNGNKLESGRTDELGELMVFLLEREM